MGFDVNGVKALLLARATGVDFSRTAMIGRQRLNLTPDEFTGVLDAGRIPHSEAAVRSIMYDHGHYSEGLMHALGASELVSVDYSDYEGAGVVHDMNRPIPEALRSRFSLVVDSGSLEHVFNFPVAVENCMRMVAPGGHFIALTPANNFMGHGFYQFSPELFFSLLNEKNGYEIEIVMAYEDRPDAEWYRVANPSALGCRVTLVNRRPVYLLVVAHRRSEHAGPFAVPSQSDYVQVWAGSAAAAARPARGKLASLALKCIPAQIKEPVKRLLARWKSRHVFDRRFFTPFDWAAGSRGIEKVIRF